MPLAESPPWRRKATDFFSTSSVKLKQAGQSAGDNIVDVAGKVGSVVKSRWAVFQEARQQQQQQQRPPHETVQERIITAAASTGLLFRKGISETKEKVAVGKVKVEEAAKKTADKSKSILNNIERWQKGVASTDVFGVPIEATVQREQSDRAVPLVLVRCADYLVISGLNNEYLFKSEGDKKVLQQLVSLYNEDSGASLLEGVNPIDVGALVKCYLASIPEPLTTFSLYDELRAARVSIPDLRNILKKLPNVNYMTLEFVTALLLRVSRKSSLNKMDSRSLAVEFAPLIMWRQGDTGTDLRNHLKFTLKPPPKIVDTTSNAATWDLLDEDDEDASSQIPLDDASPPDYSSIEVIQCLIEHHNAIFTDANETVWR
ncbi:uncharacterized Rho GTPase-activating protein At5g61530 isoform X5 [Zea mays]|nr:uncharacterized Rho GTPase-activating protein At5g61530 isoform X5 [Zea mays]ACN33558.1 unknown [Zea mays]ONM57358.1 small G protein family protein / RhoGAP family protein [Zea mays]ONM57360.1 small G protein family protein / RhoGAP family protein [Zea mays]|eukprot:XP_008651646.1 uncharacterized Rho GTPase-activating protein At5g61530 isoform X4 [Zea mays]